LAPFTLYGGYGGPFGGVGCWGVGSGQGLRIA